MKFIRRTDSYILVKCVIYSSKNCTLPISCQLPLIILLYSTVSGRPGGYPNDDFRNKQTNKQKKSSDPLSADLAGPARDLPHRKSRGRGTSPRWVPSVGPVGVRRSPV